jgi:hypothetical protein
MYVATSKFDYYDPTYNQGCIAYSALAINIVITIATHNDLILVILLDYS